MSINSTQAFAPKALQKVLSNLIPNAKLTLQQLPSTCIKLWLIEDTYASQKLDDDVIQGLWQHTPYWIFCWASGLAQAQYILQNPQTVANKIVVDFGSGSGVVAIAAALAGAKQVIACDIDPLSLDACRYNAEANNCKLQYLSDIYQLEHQYGKVDVLFAADVLYDQANRFFLDVFVTIANTIWVADSRVKNFEHTLYQKKTTRLVSTVPDLDESDEFRQVNMYFSSNNLNLSFSQ